MEVLFVIALALIAVLGAGRISARRRNKRAIPASPESYWGVELLPPPSGQCCQALQALRGHAFAKDQAPLLPLDGCTRRLQCQCRYQPLLDQRSGQDRRSGQERRALMRIDTPDRRSGKARRRWQDLWRNRR